MAMRLYTCEQLTATTHSDSRLANQMLTVKPALAGAWHTATTEKQKHRGSGAQAMPAAQSKGASNHATHPPQKQSNTVLSWRHTAPAAAPQDSAPPAAYGSSSIRGAGGGCGIRLRAHTHTQPSQQHTPTRPPSGTPQAKWLSTSTPGSASSRVANSRK